MIKLKTYSKKEKANKKARRKAFRDKSSHLKHLYRVALENIIPVNAPLALISQIQRSGGSLFSQLFDGHPQIYAHPDELNLGYPKKYIWPKIDLSNSPQAWFEILFEQNVIKHFEEGYKKGHKSEQRFLFMFLPTLQKEIFLKCIHSIESITQRDIFDSYMTSYFGAWLNYQYSSSPKKFITAFAPRLTIRRENVESFFEVYPDGRIISIIRDPKNWFPSAARHGSKKYRDLASALSQWNENALAMINNKDSHNHNVIIIHFEDLIRNTEAVMRCVAEFLGLKFDDILLIPSFNKLPIKANTSFKKPQHGIINDTLNRYKTLSQEELDTISNMTHETYEEVLNRAVRK
jgi:hypothetical protein